MTHIRTLKTLLAIVLVSLIPGCKIAVVVVEGGTVESGIALFGDLVTCTEGTICILEVNEDSYSKGKTYSAIPKPGWEFVKWNAGNDFLCANSTVPHCSLPYISENEITAQIVASSKTYYLMPLFAQITDIGPPIAMEGKAWARMDRFGDLSWDEINAVCPSANGGRCLPGGKLMAYDMTGWTWASVDDVNSLVNPPAVQTAGHWPDDLPMSFNVYLLQTGKFPPTSSLWGCSGCLHYIWRGWTSTVSDVAGRPHLAEVFVDGHVAFGLDKTTNTSLTDDSSAGHSAWFYRTP